MSTITADQRVSQAVRERSDLGVGAERGVAEAAEEPHHREVELAMAAEARRVDQP